jgi:hypothetical protein
LGEIADAELTTNYSRSLKTGEMTGGAFSQEMPLLFAVLADSKQTKLRCPVLGSLTKSGRESGRRPLLGVICE